MLWTTTKQSCLLWERDLPRGKSTCFFNLWRHLYSCSVHSWNDDKLGETGETGEIRHASRRRFLLREQIVKKDQILATIQARENNVF
mmetsp:Transcript_6601/g.16089  ORF Transcript_6601/g.16089 Transcript_6601/m.16089 type:complete len:87 (-) Transcript_6601:1711-1971(-)